MSNNKPITYKATRILLTLLLFTSYYTAFSGITYNGNDATTSDHTFTGTTTIEGNLTINGYTGVEKGATLIVKGDIIVANADVEFKILEGAEVKIYGSFTATNDKPKIILEKKGKFIIGGNLELGNEATLDFKGDTEFIVGGNFTIGNKSEIKLEKSSISVVGGDLVVPKNGEKPKLVGSDKNTPLYVLGSVDKNTFEIDKVKINGNLELKNEDDDFKSRVSVALPITLINFCAETFSNYNHLQWATASESNNDYFTIYKSIDGVNWEWLAEKASANGNSSTRTNYEFIDNNVEYGITYYKLEQTDFDGTTETSKVISVESNVEKADFVISKDRINVTFANTNETQTVTITSVQGGILYKKSFTGVYDAFIETANIVSKGVYIISLHTINGTTNQTFVR